MQSLMWVFELFIVDVKYVATYKCKKDHFSKL